MFVWYCIFSAKKNPKKQQHIPVFSVLQIQFALKQMDWLLSHPFVPLMNRQLSQQYGTKHNFTRILLLFF